MESLPEGGQYAAEQEGNMSRRSRRNHSPGFKAKVAGRDQRRAATGVGAFFRRIFRTRSGWLRPGITMGPARRVCPCSGNRKVERKCTKIIGMHANGVQPAPAHRVGREPMSVQLARSLC